MPIAAISLGEILDDESIDAVAPRRYSHQLSGSCSAHPCFNAFIGASAFG